MEERNLLLRGQEIVSGLDDVKIMWACVNLEPHKAQHFDAKLTPLSNGYAGQICLTISSI